MNNEFEAGNRPVWLTDKEAEVCEKIYK
jgi:hypothetical protein